MLYDVAPDTAVQVSMTVVFPGVAIRPLGTPAGTAAGVADAADEADEDVVPTPPVAMIVYEYDVLFVRPVSVYDVVAVEPTLTPLR